LSEETRYKRFEHKKLRRVLVMRMQAIGDINILLPYLQSLREQLPKEVEIDFLTRDIGTEIASQLTIFNNIYAIGGERNSKKQLLSFLFRIFPRLIFKRYDIIYDLQNHRLSKIIRFLLPHNAYTIFDRTSSQYAGDRYKNSINIPGLSDVKFKPLNCFKETDSSSILEKFGLQADANYIVINPAGVFETRNWALGNFVSFCKMWNEQVNSKTQFVYLGLTRDAHKAEYFKNALKEKLINLVGQTSQYEALMILKHVQLVVSEDSGLLHMSYAVGTPTIGILGSTRNDWTNPNLPHTYFFNSSDLTCGNCMREKCLHEEVICLTRIRPEHVVQKAKDLMNTSAQQQELLIKTQE
jgi:heptosyltransferase II